MIYAPDIAADKQLLRHSRELVREAMALLRTSDHLVSGQRLRAELEQERRSRRLGGTEKPAGSTEFSAAQVDQNRCAKASQAVTAMHRATAA